VVMDRGQVVEVGPHDELMAKEGAYWRLYQAQLRRADGDDLDAINAEDALPVLPPNVSAHHEL
jgi:ATP-binding cassette, subfamily B, bacterial